MTAAPDLNDFYYFVQSVDHCGFAAADRALGIPKSTLSRRVIALESRLGVRLIERTSRRFVLTDMGREFYRHAQAMLIEADAAEEAVTRRLAEPSGTVRLTCSLGMARFLADPLTRFLAAYPKINLVQVATNRYVDLVEEGIDVAVRGHFRLLPDSEFIQRRLSPTPWHAYAAPVHLEREGTPEQPQDLARHAAVSLGSRSDEATWHLYAEDGEEAIVAFVPRLRSDDLETLRMAAIAGLGLVSLPAYIAREDVSQGRLERVLPDWVTQSPDAGVTLLTPSRRGRLPSVRALIDFLVTEYPQIASGL
jgi:DNA-binding transcriptional LysR family regulator